MSCLFELCFVCDVFVSRTVCEYLTCKHRVLCTVFCILCTVYCVLCTVYCVLCTVYCVMCTVYCVLCTVYCVLCTVYCVLCTVYCVLCTVCCVLCPVYCVLRTVRPREKAIRTRMGQHARSQFSIWPCFEPSLGQQRKRREPFPTRLIEAQLGFARQQRIPTHRAHGGGTDTWKAQSILQPPKRVVHLNGGAKCSTDNHQPSRHARITIADVVAQNYGQKGGRQSKDKAAP